MKSRIAQGHRRKGDIPGFSRSSIGDSRRRIGRGKIVDDEFQVQRAVALVGKQLNYAIFDKNPVYVDFSLRKTDHSGPNA